MLYEFLKADLIVAPVVLRGIECSKVLQNCILYFFDFLISVIYSRKKIVLYSKAPTELLKGMKIRQKFSHKNRNDTAIVTG